MSNDRELLEMAAKAAGIDIEPGYGHAGSPESEMFFQDDQGFCQSWNPLTDDGDALRLAVKLSLNVSIYYDCGMCFADDEIEQHAETNRDDPYAATRRAIVRAASEIERSMK